MALNVTPEELRAKILEQQNKGKRTETTKKSTGDNASYPFWNTPVDQQATIRFLPDLDPDNLAFWVERQTIKLPFEGVVGGDYPTNKKVEVTVPCVDMFGMSCPITNAIRPLWKGSEDDINLARVYYKKRTYIFQGFVVQSPFVEENVPENPIRRFVLNPSIYEIVKQSLTNTDFERLPVDYMEGRDFNIKKIMKGKHANYATSSWSFRTRSLTENEQVAIEQHGLYNLKDYLGRIPDSDEIAAIKAMFDASMAGEAFDMESFGQYYRPYGVRNYDNDSATDNVASAARSAMTTGAVAAPIEESAPAPAAPAAGGQNAKMALDAIKRLQARQRGE